MYDKWTKKRLHVVSLVSNLSLYYVFAVKLVNCIIRYTVDYRCITGYAIGSNNYSFSFEQRSKIFFCSVCKKIQIERYRFWLSFHKAENHSCTKNIIDSQFPHISRSSSLHPYHHRGKNTSL